MGVEPQDFAIDAARSAIGWWADAGVDTVLAETPFDWLGTARPAKSASAPEPRAPELPESHAAFVDWLGTARFPGVTVGHRRIAPAGDPSSALMILADFPQGEDIDARTHFSGPLATLFDRMLATLGHTRDSVYIATLAPWRPTTSRLPDDVMAALTPVARHHLELVRPKRLWLMGSAASRAILGIDDAAAKGKLHQINLDGAIVHVIATAHPRLFEGSKARKAAAWTEMQRLIGIAE